MLRAMEALSDVPVISYELPLSESGQEALQSALLHSLGTLPFNPGALISRSLWIIFIGAWGAWTHATLPVDDMLDLPNQEITTGLWDLAASLISPASCHRDERAMIVLRRPGSAEVSEADLEIFRLVRQAAVDRKTASWTFHVVGPGGMRQVTEA